MQLSSKEKQTRYRAKLKQSGRFDESRRVNHYYKKEGRTVKLRENIGEEKQIIVQESEFKWPPSRKIISVSEIMQEYV